VSANFVFTNVAKLLAASAGGNQSPARGGGQGARLIWRATPDDQSRMMVLTVLRGFPRNCGVHATDMVIIRAAILCVRPDTELVGLIEKSANQYSQPALRVEAKRRKLPQLMPESELLKFFKVIQEAGDLQHEIMLKLLFLTAVRVSELIKIKVGDIDFEQCKIFIGQGKGGENRFEASELKNVTALSRRTL
jgi:integrase